MTTVYAFVGAISNELLSHKGRVLVHDNKAEMEYLVPGYRVIKLPAADIGRPLMWLRQHPDLAAVTWPLDLKEFR